MTNRALLLGSLGHKPSSIINPLLARDTELMIEALRSLGTTVTLRPRTSDELQQITIEPNPWERSATIDCGLAGTVMRFVPASAAIAAGDISFDGDPRARERPMAVIIKALRELGADVESRTDALPFVIHGTGSIAGGLVTLDASDSSQFVSALLLAGARYEAGITVQHVGPAMPSLPHVQMTVDMLRAAGVTVRPDPADPAAATWTVEPGPIELGTVKIEPDLSNAAAFLAAAMVTAGRVTIRDWPTDTTQAGDAIRDLFAQMGGFAELTEAGLTVTGPDTLSGIDVDLHAVGELTPTVAATCALATTPSRLHGIGHLEGHETDRLAALVTEIRRLGGEATVEADGISIVPKPLRGGIVDSYNDHRMATFGAILGLAVPGVQVRNIETTSKTMPNFQTAWADMVNGNSST